MIVGSIILSIDPSVFLLGIAFTVIGTGFFLNPIFLLW